jgi:hypothetical protein
MTENMLVNKVAESELITLDLEKMFRSEPVISFDLKDFLFQGLILKEKDFREALKVYDWSSLAGAHVAVHCSADAIVPRWAYMLVSAFARPFAKTIRFGSRETVADQLMLEKIENLDWTYLQDKRVVIKGCSENEIPAAAYLAISAKLQPVVQSMMYGEPCSTVPIFKRPRKLE